MKEIVLYFLKIGLLGFGGPLAHIAMMEAELVEKRGWAKREVFLEGLAIANLVPGPASTQLGIYMGYVRGGIKGGILAGIAFILPAFLMMTGLSYLYFEYGAVLQIQGMLYGIHAMVIALIVNSLVKMTKNTVQDLWGAGIVLSTVLSLYFTGVNMILVLIGGGVLGWLVYGGKSQVKKPQSKRLYSFSLLPLLLQAGVTQLFLFFMKVGAFIYGGGLVIIPFIEREVVERLGWLTQQEFLTGISFGQITPGPVVTTAAFIGYKVFGFLGALAATTGIFLPSFVLILAVAPHLEKIKQRSWATAALKGVNAAVIGTIFSSVLSLIPGSLPDGITMLIGAAGLIALWRYRVNPVYCIGAAGVLGLLLS